MKLIVGLGNPGLKYNKTRHNVGFMVVNEFAKELGIKLKKHSAFQGEYNETVIAGERLLLLKPTTYMNRSGASVKAVVNYFNIETADILIIYDDLDLPVGTTKFRKSGGHGGHNGMRSIIQHLDTKSFNRARIGIGRPPEGESVIHHVLKRFPKQEKDLIDQTLTHVSKACFAWTENDFDKVMNEFN